MSNIVYPESKRIDHIDDYHGIKVLDSYRWLEDSDSKETKEWIDDQNSITHDYLNKQCKDKSHLKEVLKDMVNYERYSTPYVYDDYTFYFKNDGLQNQSILYKRKNNDEKDQVLLDPNKLSKDGTSAISSCEWSENGKYLAYAISENGSDWSRIYVRNVDTTKDLSLDVLEWVKFSSISWTHDHRGFFYSRYPAP